MTLSQSLDLVPMAELLAAIDRRKHKCRDATAMRVVETVAECFSIAPELILSHCRTDFVSSARDTVIIALESIYGYSARNAAEAIGQSRDTPKRRRQRLAARIERNPRIGQLHASAMKATAPTSDSNEDSIDRM